MTLFRSLLIAGLASLYAYVAFLMLNPDVSEAYFSYYISQESDLSPTEVRLQMQQEAEILEAVSGKDKNLQRSYNADDPSDNL